MKEIKLLSKTRWDEDVDTSEEYVPLEKDRRKIPTHKNTDYLSSFVGAIFAASAIGIAWFVAAKLAGFETPWVALLLGIAVPISMSFSGGRGDPEFQASLSLVMYVVALVLILSVLTYDKSHIMRNNLSLETFEQQMVTRHIQNGSNLIAYFCGMITSMALGFYLNRN